MARPPQPRGHPASFIAGGERVAGRERVADGERFGRQQLAGGLLALYLVSGSWSVARIAGVEPSPLWEPRVWAVALLALLALLPSGPRTRSTRSAIVPEIAWLGFSLLAITWAPDLEYAGVQAVDITLLL